MAAHHVGIRTNKLSIEQDGDSYGYHLHANALKNIELECDISPKVRQGIENTVLVCLAGPTAQVKFNPNGYRHLHGQWDKHQAVELLDLLCGSNERVQEYFDLMDTRARQFIEEPDNWSAISAVAEALLSEGTISGKRLKDVIKHQ